MKIEELQVEERLALGGLIRLVIRADGAFSEAEEARIDRIGDELGGRDVMWKIISDAAQAFPDEQGIRAATLAVTRVEARNLILEVLASVAAADTITPAEMGVIDAVRAAWGRPDEQPGHVTAFDNSYTGLST